MEKDSIIRRIKKYKIAGHSAKQPVELPADAEILNVSFIDGEFFLFAVVSDEHDTPKVQVIIQAIITDSVVRVAPKNRRYINSVITDVFEAHYFEYFE